MIESAADPSPPAATSNAKTDGDELTNTSICSSSSITETVRTTTSERDTEDCYADVGFMFEGLQTSTLKRFTWGDKTNEKKPEIRVALHVVDDQPGALQSGHYLWQGAPLLTEFLLANVSALSCLRQPANVLELGAGSALPSFCALQLFSESLQCIVVTDHDPGTIERARDNYETTLEDLLESTKTEEEQLDCINGLASVPVMFETLEWGELDRAQEIATAVADHSSPLVLEETTQERGFPAEQQYPQNPNHSEERNIFDLLLGSDLIYCPSVIKPLFLSVSHFMAPSGSFLLSQSLNYDDATERSMDEISQSLGLKRIILKDTLSKDKDEAGGIRIQHFSWRNSVVDP